MTSKITKQLYSLIPQNQCEILILGDFSLYPVLQQLFITSNEINIESVNLGLP
jgi:hypothetical protein